MISEYKPNFTKKNVVKILDSNRGANDKYPSAERWDLEFGYQTPQKYV